MDGQLRHVKTMDKYSYEQTSKKRKLSMQSEESNHAVGNETKTEISLNMLDDDMVFTKEDLRHIDKSAQKYLVQVVEASPQTCMDFPNHHDVQIFEKWYNISLRPGNK
ncbi:Uncharacterized protein Fot_34757 [Forsythia ovata]|uniref:Uncharacterized protein n=1 Tax=Forsythia ovata TaxID=205694 RepID=A0ABD1SL13_9LAMI